MSNYLGPSSELMEHAQRLWGTRGVYRLIRGNENWVYALDGTNLIVRFTADYHRSKTEIEGELEFIQYLHSSGCSVVAPVASSTGEFVHALDSVWCAAVFETARGQLITREDHFTKAMAENWGAAIAEMHMHTQNYSPPKIKRRAWNSDDGYVLANKMIPVLGKDHFMSSIFLDCVSQMELKSKNSDVYGLIHADLHHGNFFVDENQKLVIFDFDDACYKWYLFDLALPLAHIELSVLMKRYPSTIRQFKEDIVNGYAKHRSLPANIDSELKMFIRYRMAHLYLWGESRIRMQRTNDIEIIEQMKSVCQDYLRVH